MRQVIKWQRIFQGDNIWIAEEKPSSKSKNIPSGHDTTQITILPYNFGPFLPASTQGDNYSIIELKNGKKGTIRINDTYGTVCTTTHCRTCGQL